MRSCSSSSMESRSTEEILENMESGGSNVHTDHQNHEERREVEQDGDMEGALQRNEREL